MENSLDLAEWAADLIMFSTRRSGNNGSGAGITGGGDMKNSSRSRVSTATSMRRSQQTNKSQRLGNKIAQMSTNTLLPTILDETQATTVSMDVGTTSSQAEKNAEDEMDMLIRKSKRDNLFGTISKERLL